MKLTASFLFVLVLMTGSAMAQTVDIDYDQDYYGQDYEDGQIKTFTWVKSSETSVAETDPLLHSRIVNGIEYYLTRVGIREVENDPDVYVTYHASSKQEVHLNTSTMNYGYPSAWHRGGYYGGYGGYGAGAGMSTTTVSTYDMGTLVVDVWDAKSETLIWRGMASNIVLTQNPQKMEKKIDKALKKMMDKWGKIKKKAAKEKAKAEKKAAKG